MGGLGSGRRKKRQHRTVETCLMLDADRLSLMGNLRSGLPGFYHWPDSSFDRLTHRASSRRRPAASSGLFPSQRPAVAEKNGKMWPTPFLLNAGLAISVATASTSAVRVFVAPVAAGACSNCTSCTASFAAGIATNSSMPVPTRGRGSVRSGAPTCCGSRLTAKAEGTAIRPGIPPKRGPSPGFLFV